MIFFIGYIGSPPTVTVLPAAIAEREIDTDIIRVPIVLVILLFITVCDF
jgi:hypothetical protein